MSEILIAFGLVLVIEGLFYALFPERMKKFMTIALKQSNTVLRNAGLIAVVIGLIIIIAIK
jgi:uncharacterized protein